jgi:UDP-glucuronate 4-epimerase
VKKILVTGAAGFIGYNLINILAKENNIVGVDDINPYYSTELKRNRIELLSSAHPTNFTFNKINLSDKDSLKKIFIKTDFDYVINLAAQAGVRYSMENPDAYIQSNIIGFYNLLECIKESKVKHFMFASSSSVYGMNKNSIFNKDDCTDAPVSLYAATKKSNEIIAHSYSHLYGIPSTGLRFFTVYGPWGRPDMAYYNFTKMIMNDEIINVYGDGSSLRDYTYISDVVDCIKNLIPIIPKSGFEFSKSRALFQIYNIGNNKPVKLIEFINTLEGVIGKKAKLNFIENQKGDVPFTYADIQQTSRDLDYQPKVKITEGLTNFYKWYQEYYNVST